MKERSFALRRARLEPLLESARSIRDPNCERGQRARARLIASSGLSPAGVDFALERCLEAEPSEAEIEALLRSTEEAPAAHVLLSANVFVAAHRAIAIGLASSERVQVRPSRREPELAQLLLEGAPGAFQLRAELHPEPGDHLWAYGSDETLAQVTRTLAPGVVFHPHGSGFGVGILARQYSDEDLEQLLTNFAEDIALFDQRGCLSPRVLLVSAGAELARTVARQLAGALASLEQRVPRGHLAADEQAEIARYRDTASYVGELFEAGRGFVSFSEELLLAPVGRNLHVVPSSSLGSSLAPWSPFITTCAVAGAAPVHGELARHLPGARCCDFGRMQTPPFDGPVDRRKA